MSSARIALRVEYGCQEVLGTSLTKTALEVKQRDTGLSLAVSPASLPQREMSMPTPSHSKNIKGREPY